MNAHEVRRREELRLPDRTLRRLLSACGCSAIASAIVLDTGVLLQSSNLTTRRPLPGVTPDTST